MANDTISSERDRRVLSHLSIPRNVEDLSSMLRSDHGYALQTDEQGRPVWQRVDPGEVHKTLDAMKRAGFVVNLGEHESMGKLAAAVESSEARTMPDEKASIFARRAESDPHRWRTVGDVWMMTDAGRDASRAATQEVVPPAMTTTQVRSAIASEWARVIQDAPLEGSLHDEQGGKLPDGWEGSLMGHLLPEEFQYWLGLVLAEHERLWGKREAEALRSSLPMAGGSQFSDFYEAILLDAENQKASITAAAPWFMALVETTAVTDADTGSTLDEPEYTGYARKSVAAADMNAASGSSGSVVNANAITFAACTAGTDTVIGFAHCVAATTGQVRKYGTCASTVISTTQTPATFAAGAYATSIA